jgi:CheY-like chemotaxis protein
MILLSLERAFALDPGDARVFFELDQLEKRLNCPPQERLRRLEQTARRAAELTQELLAYSGRGRLSKERVQLSGVVEEMARLLHATVSRTATLECHFAPDAPWVEADVAQLRQVVMNLILNAAEACTRPGTVRLSVGRATMERAELAGLLLGASLPAGEYAWLEVQDDGVGMHPDVVARIFDPFFTTKFTGRGLGLAAVLGIVRGHGGALQVDSEPGRGTRFRVVLPTCLPPRLLPAAATPSASAAVAAEPSDVRRTVLIVDDDNTVRLLAQTVLQRAGYSTLVAVDGLTALELFARHADEIGLVLLDMTMPRMSGGEVLRTLRALRPELPVVVSSGYLEAEAAEQFGPLGPGGFLQKPYDSSRLLGAVGEALRQSSRAAKASAGPAGER